MKQKLVKPQVSDSSLPCGFTHTPCSSLAVVTHLCPLVRVKGCLKPNDEGRTLIALGPVATLCRFRTPWEKMKTQIYAASDSSFKPSTALFYILVLCVSSWKSSPWMLPHKSSIFEIRFKDESRCGKQAQASRLDERQGRPWVLRVPADWSWRTKFLLLLWQCMSDGTSFVLFRNWRPFAVTQC